MTVLMKRPEAWPDKRLANIGFVSFLGMGALAKGQLARTWLAALAKRGTWSGEGLPPR
jgi:hypothetical protein